MQDLHQIRVSVREIYAQVAQNNGGCCGAANTCGEPGQPASIDSTRLGYASADLQLLPQGADLGLGCGNPQAIANLKPGETVLDLGSGAGVDCFLAAHAVGKQGRVIGIDMTPDMLHKARENARQGDYPQVEFRRGEIEHLPVADASVDVIISNCVINLSPDKAQVFRDAFRVLKPGGRLAVSDVVARAELPAHFKHDEALYCGCMSGAETPEHLRGLMQAAGFANIRIEAKNDSREFIQEWAPGKGIEDYVVSASIEAYKPA
jgi:SAM-dependent methyltransferase